LAETPGLNLNGESFDMFGCVAVKSSAFLIYDADLDVQSWSRHEKMDTDKSFQ